jgi:iron complex transport system substrate-binding protein
MVNMMNIRKILAVGTLVVVSQLGTAATSSPTAAVFDLGSLDTMAALKLEAHVVGVPKQTLPDYLTQFKDALYADVGGLKTPDLETLKALKPDIVVITGRQAASKAELETISKVKQVDASGDDYWQSLRDNVTSIATLFDAQPAAESALTALKTTIETSKMAIKGAPTTLFVTHNNGSFGLRDEPIATQLLGLASPALPPHVKPQQRGTRTFTSLTISNIAEMKPTSLFIIDRSAAIGNTKEALDVEKLKANLAAQGGQNIQVTYLSPKLWYLSGNGLQSLNMQIKEITDAL